MKELLANPAILLGLFNGTCWLFIVCVKVAKKRHGDKISDELTRSVPLTLSVSCAWYLMALTGIAQKSQNPLFHSAAPYLGGGCFVIMIPYAVNVIRSLEHKKMVGVSSCDS